MTYIQPPSSVNSPQPTPLSGLDRIPACREPILQPRILNTPIEALKLRPRWGVDRHMPLRHVCFGGSRFFLVAFSPRFLGGGSAVHHLHPKAGSKSVGSSEQLAGFRKVLALRQSNNGAVEKARVLSFSVIYLDLACGRQLGRGQVVYRLARSGGSRSGRATLAGLAHGAHCIGTQVRRMQ